jgi:hypothetical protein
MRIRAAVLLLTLFGASLAFALPAASPLGPTGLFTIPTADTLPLGAVGINVYGFERSHGEAYAANYGAIKNLEVGFTRVRMTDEVLFPDVKTTFVNAKYAFQSVTDSKPGIAVGAIDATNEVNTTLYLVVTQPIPISELYGIDAIRATLGLAAGGNKATALPLNGFFGGLELDAFGMATITAEHDGSALNAGLRLAPVSGLTLNIGSIRKSHITTYGISYSKAL